MDAPIRILLVEDNPGDARLVRELVREGLGTRARLEHVEQIAAARARLALGGLDLVLCDLQLPDGGGIETYRAVAEAAVGTPIVMLTGSADEAVGREAVRRGAQDFLDKNQLTAQGVARAIQYALERHGLLARQQRVEGELRTKTRQLEGVTGALEEFLGGGPWETAARTLLSEATALTGSPAGFLAQVLERRYLKVIASSAPAELPELVELDERALAARVVDTGEAHTADLEASAAELETLGCGPAAVAAVPLKRAGEVVAVLCVAGGEAYGPRALGQLAVLARAGEVLFECHARRLEQAALEERLRCSEKMEAVGTLAAGVAHHFNNLLMIMLGNGELILNKCAPGDAVRKNAEAITAAGRRAGELIEQMTTCQKPLPATSVELNALAAGTLETVRSVVPPEIKLRFEPYAMPSTIPLDATQLEQVLLNLVLNARDAMAAAGEITVETSHVNVDSREDPLLPPAPGRYALLSVSDNGSGIAPDVLSRIFEPFFTTRETGSGNGLGLFVVYGIVQRCGGHITVDSEPGRGSTFHVYLPRVDPPAIVDAPAAATAAAPGDRETILVVEDDREMRGLVSSKLRQDGYTVIEAAHGGEALNLAERGDRRIDLLVTDAVMPHMSGSELARRLAEIAGALKVLYVKPRPIDLASLASQVRELLDDAVPVAAA